MGTLVPADTEPGTNGQGRMCSFLAVLSLAHSSVFTSTASVSYLILKLIGEPGYFALVLLNSKLNGKFNGGWSKHHDHPWEGPDETSFPWQALGGPCVSVREWWTLTSGVIHPNGSGESRRRDAATSRRVQRVARCGH